VSWLEDHWREIAMVIIFILMMGFMIYIYQNVEIMKAAPMEYCREVLEREHCIYACGVKGFE